MDFMNFIFEEALIVIPVLWIIGVFLKKTPNIADWFIVWILLLVGIVATVALLGFTAQAVLQGVLVVGAAVLGHQLLKQTTER